MNAVSRRARVVAALIITGDRGRVLVQQRPPGKARPLLWEFPGGKVESGESDVVALRREAREELGVDIEVGAQRFETCHLYPDLEVELHVYEARVLSGTPRPLSGQVLKEVALEDLASLRFCDADTPLVQELLEAASEARGRLPE